MADAAGGAEEREHPAEAAEREPDYRFTLANERTFLAWIRTSLGLIAGGVVVHQLFEPLADVPRRIIAIGCVVLASAVAAGAYFHWRSVQRAMRRSDPLPGSTLVPILAIGATVIAVGAVVAVVVS